MNEKDKNSIKKFIATVQKQIDYFDHVLNKNKGNLSLQAKFYPLKYEFSKLLEYLEQEKNRTKSWGRTIETENKIFNIIKKHVEGVSVNLIKIELDNQSEKPINESTMANRLYSLHRVSKIIERVSKGVYKVKPKFEEDK